MPSCNISSYFLRVFALIFFCSAAPLTGQSQDAKQTTPQASKPDSASVRVQKRNEWFLRGRVVPGKPSADLRRRAYQQKLQMRAQHAAALAAARATGQSSLSSGSWTPLGPLPLASDATGNGTQDYHQVSGRATAVVIDPADPTGNTVYIGGAQSGVWTSTNAANITASSVTWTALTDDQATLSIGALAIQPGNTDPSQTVILAATGEADNSADSYFGLGILRSADAGTTWTLISTAHGGALSFSGLGGARMAFSTSQKNTVVAAMAITPQGLTDGEVTGGTTPGLYTSLDAGLTWTYDALKDPGGVAIDATSATSVVYNASAGLFFAAIRYHGFYSSTDGVTWTRLAAQPGGAALSATACPPQSSSNNYACPIYRAELAVSPGHNTMYAWFISLSSTGSPVDGGIWQSLNGGAAWTAISDAGITNCGDVEGCGVQQGSYNLELLAVPNGSGTDLYAGAVNLYKCSINSQNPTCTATPFVNLTHVYGCDPIAAPSHVHPDQHALAFVIPTAGGDSGNALMYFANDGGIYRALDGYGGLTTGSCSGTNQFDDLNQDLGSMTQFISFSQHPTDPNTLLGGAQGNGSPATNQAKTNSAWINLLGGDGGYNAIDPNAANNFYASNPDVPPAGLGIQLCTSGVSCIDSGFNFVATSSTVGGDDGAFYFPYILDPQSSTALLIGTCRVWRGPRSGGAFTALSPNFDTLDSGTCSGAEVNQVRALAAGGPSDANGSLVLYATTGGLGPINGPPLSPTGGHVWVTTNATAGVPAFADVTGNGPSGSINPNQFPISGAAIDPSDPTGSTAFVTVMGFTGGAGHVWKTVNAGATWTDFTANLPDSPVNAVVVDNPSAKQVYIGTDVGVFASSTSSASWTELGPAPSTGLPGVLPNVAVTALGLFNSGGQKLLRASTYGRGIWQFSFGATPNFQLSIPNSNQTIFVGQTATFSGTASELNGYANSITLSCVAGTTPPPSTCSIVPSTLTPVNNTPFTVTAGGASGNYNFKVQGLGSDPAATTNTVSVTLSVGSLALGTPAPASVTVRRGTTSAPVSFQVTAGGSFNQSVTVTCTLAIPNATCTLTPATPVIVSASTPLNMTATVTVPSVTVPAIYPVTIQATTAGTSPLSTSFSLNVTFNPNFTLAGPSGGFPEVNSGSSGTNAPIVVDSVDAFKGTVSLTVTCPTAFGTAGCTFSPASVNSFPTTTTLTINGQANGSNIAAGAYSLSITGTSGSLVNTITVPFNVGDYTVAGPQTLSLPPGGQGSPSFTLGSSNSYSGNVNATCNASALAGATCTLSPANPIAVPSGGTATIIATINVPNNAAPGVYSIPISTQDTTGAPSHAITLSLKVAPDFILTSSTPSQTVSVGQTTGPYNLTLQPVGYAFNSAVTLSCSGLPASAQCLFSPSTPVTPGNSAADVVMSISTAAPAAGSRSPVTGRFAAPAIWLVLPGIVIGWAAVSSPRKRKLAHLASSTVLFSLMTFALLSCGGVSTGGGGGGCSAPPTVPTGLASSSTSATGTTLNWTSSTAIAGCSVANYVVYQGATQIATPVSTTYTVTALSPSTQYTFSVAARDSDGLSAQSTPITVTTLNSGTPPGTYTITVTGASSGAPPDPGQSTHVTLVVH